MKTHKTTKKASAPETRTPQEYAVFDLNGKQLTKRLTKHNAELWAKSPLTTGMYGEVRVALAKDVISSEMPTASAPETHITGEGNAPRYANEKEVSWEQGRVSELEKKLAQVTAQRDELRGKALASARKCDELLAALKGVIHLLDAVDFEDEGRSKFDEIKRARALITKAKQH
jgi:hypothetical protein